MSRASTLQLALLVLTVLLGGLCLAVSRGQLRGVALRRWGWGLLVYSAGILITLATVLPVGLIKVIGNSLIAYAPILSIEGVLALTRYRLHRRWTFAALLLSVLPIVVNHLSEHYLVLVDILLPAPIAIVLFVLGALLLLRDPPREARPAARLLAASLLLSVLVWVLRIALIWVSVGDSNDRDRADLVVALVGIAQMVAAVAATLGLLWVQVRTMEAELRRLADSDALTGLPNRRATVARCEDELARARRHGRSFALLLLDVDHFKQINDTHGHQRGDRALQHLADVLRAEGREADRIGRIGGEEFVVLLSEEGREGAEAAAERLRQTVAASELKDGEPRLALSVSGGLALYPQDGGSWDALYTVADQRLYAAKRGGRNRIVGTASPPEAAAG